MKEVTSVLKDLIALPSVNPTGRDDLAKDLIGESRVNEYIIDFIKNLGLEVIIQKTELQGRDNVGTMLYKGEKYKTIILQAHTDTVDINDNLSLLSPIEKDGKVYGRGACDDKGSLACMLAAIADMANNISELNNNIIFLGVADEEYTWKGSLALITTEPTKSADFGIVGEPTNCCIVNGYKGVARWDIETYGKSSHSSQPERGINAIYKMSKVLNLIEDYNIELSRINDPPIGKETISVGTIKGGRSINIVPDKCTIGIDRRLTRKTSPCEAQKALYEYLKNNSIDFKVYFSPLKDAQEAALISKNHPGIRLAISICKALKLNSEPIQVAFGSDAYRMNKVGIPTVIFGPGSIDVAHGNNEYVSIKELKQVKDFYYMIMKKDLSADTDGSASF